MAEKLSKEQTSELYSLCLKMIEFAEGIHPDFKLRGEDRMSLALSPVFAALFEQAKHRYRPSKGATVLVAATMLRNFAMSDELHEMGLVQATYEFMHMMNETHELREKANGTATI